MYYNTRFVFCKQFILHSCVGRRLLFVTELRKCKFVSYILTFQVIYLYNVFAENTRHILPRDPSKEEISNEDFSVESFSSRMAMSSSMLYRKMKALTGLSPNRFIVDVRLKRAAQLLESQAYTISEVAYKVGFSDMHYFSTCFKRMFGMTPSEYKTQKI